MVFILDSNSEHVAHACSKIGIFREKKWILRLFRSNQMPSANRNTWFTPYLRYVFWATIWYKHMVRVRVLTRFGRSDRILIRIGKTGSESGFATLYSHPSIRVTIYSVFIVKGCESWEEWGGSNICQRYRLGDYTRGYWGFIYLYLYYGICIRW